MHVAHLAVGARGNRTSALGDMCIASLGSRSARRGVAIAGGVRPACRGRGVRTARRGGGVRATGRGGGVCAAGRGSGMRAGRRSWSVSSPTPPVVGPWLPPNPPVDGPCDPPPPVLPPVFAGAACAGAALGAGAGLFVAPALAIPHRTRTRAMTVAAEAFFIARQSYDFVIISSFLFRVRAPLRRRERSIEHC